VRGGMHGAGGLKILGNTHLVVIQGILTMKPPLLAEHVSALVTVKFLECHDNLEQVMIKQHDICILRVFFSSLPKNGTGACSYPVAG